MHSSARSATLAIALGIITVLFVTMPANVSAQTELKVNDDALPVLKPVPMPSFPELQPGLPGSRYAACNNAAVPFAGGGQKELQVYIEITSRRARCIEADTAGSEALHDRRIVDLYQQKYTELSAVLVSSQEILDGEQSISKKQLIDYSSYVNEEIGLLMVLSAFAECKALEANSLAMNVDPRCDTDRLQEIIATREQDGRAQHAHTQSLFTDFELEPFRKLPAITTPQQLISIVTSRQYRPIETGAEVLDIVILEKHDSTFLPKEKVDQYGSFLILEVSYSSEPEPQDLQVQISLNAGGSLPVNKTLVLGHPQNGPYHLTGDFVFQSGAFTLWPAELAPLPSPLLSVSP